MWRRIWGFIDWRFVIALCLLVGVAGAVHGALEAGQERDRVIASQVIERKQASAERDRLLQGQRELSAKYERLIRWLNGQSIDVPPEVLNGNGHTTIRVEDNDDNDSDDDSDSDDGDDSRPPTNGPTTPPTSRPPATGGGGGSDQGGNKSGRE